VNFLLPKAQFAEADAKLLLEWLEQRYPDRVKRK